LKLTNALRGVGSSSKEVNSYSIGREMPRFIERKDSLPYSRNSAAETYESK